MYSYVSCISERCILLLCSWKLAFPKSSNTIMWLYKYVISNHTLTQFALILYLYTYIYIECWLICHWWSWYILNIIHCFNKWLTVWIGACIRFIAVINNDIHKLCINIIFIVVYLHITYCSIYSCTVIYDEVKFFQWCFFIVVNFIIISSTRWYIFEYKRSNNLFEIIFV